ncbi:PPC domain-containing protein [Gloeocapsa sp. PCC 73106]|uniref:PPC domain-containing protein n=1 Tax=Gloeocapsa sp. PCC 73106 TaxID=102232 RepID=UPI0002ABBBB1|nr:PPC domain-containing protein [Gloeocapsa sp. PCC 73106]ELR97208.1 putative pre-peptidase [Gloeocapsa sp. PCC 73106]
MKKYFLNFGVSIFTILSLSGPSWAQLRMYNPISLPSGNEIEDTLSDKDIPTGEGGFARDYSVYLEKDDQVAIDLISDDFDTIVSLLAADGSKVAENDDGPDGSNNSLLFARISESGNYIIRVRAFGETGGGQFKLKLTRLRPLETK